MSESGNFQADTLTQDQVVTILKTGTYPYKILRFFTQKQKFPDYPSVEVRRTGSPSTTSNVQSTTIDTTFEVTLLLKYTREEEFEEADRLVTEDEILTLLENVDLPPPGKIFFEQKTWNTTPIDEPIYGSKSVLRFTFREILSTTGEGIVGAYNSFELDSTGAGSPLLGPVSIQILALNDISGVTVDSHSIDTGQMQYDPRELTEGEINITYESTPTIDALVDQLFTAREEFKGKLVRNGVSKNVLFLVGTSTRTSAYEQVEKVTTAFYVVGTW